MFVLIVRLGRSSRSFVLTVRHGFLAWFSGLVLVFALGGFPHARHWKWRRPWRFSWQLSPRRPWPRPGWNGVRAGRGSAGLGSAGVGSGELGVRRLGCRPRFLLPGIDRRANLCRRQAERRGDRGVGQGRARGRWPASGGGGGASSAGTRTIRRHGIVGTAAQTVRRARHARDGGAGSGEIGRRSHVASTAGKSRDESGGRRGRSHLARRLAETERSGALGP